MIEGEVDGVEHKDQRTDILVAALTGHHTILTDQRVLLRLDKRLHILNTSVRLGENTMYNYLVWIYF